TVAKGDIRRPRECAAKRRRISWTAQGLFEVARRPYNAIGLFGGLAERLLDPAIVDDDVVGVVTAIGADRVIAVTLQGAPLRLGVGLPFAIPDRRRTHLGMGRREYGDSTA